MARKYVRDNRGRFARVGATARGGRLRTPKGNKRATVTMQGPKRANTVAKPRGLKPGAVAARRAAKPGKAPARAGSPATSTLRPGELMNAYARPVGLFTGVTSKKARANPFTAKTMKGNAQIAADIARSAGVPKVGTYRKGPNRRRGTAEAARAVANTFTREGRIEFNELSPSWKNVKQAAQDQRRKGWWSSSSPTHVVQHEIGHLKDSMLGARGYTGLAPWGVSRQVSSKAQSIAKRVSGYAATSEAELVAEVYAGRRAGKRYDREVMQAYREVQRLPAKPLARRRSRLRRKAS